MKRGMAAPRRTRSSGKITAGKPGGGKSTGVMVRANRESSPHGPVASMAGTPKSNQPRLPRWIHLLWVGLLLTLIPFACNFPGGGLRAEPTPQPTSDEPAFLFTRPTRMPSPTPDPADSDPAGPNSDPAEPAQQPELVTPPAIGNSEPPLLYYTQAGDTLPAVAVRHGVLPEEITSPDNVHPEALLNPGQLLVIPNRLGATTPDLHLLPDSEVIYSPSAIDFDIEAFVNSAGGRLSRHTQFLGSSGTVTGAEMIEKIALDNSINPMVLLALLEYHSGWVYGEPANQTQEMYPMGFVDRSQEGLYRQLVWTVNQLSVGYYGWREGRLNEINFADGTTLHLAPDLNAGTAALQYLFAQLYGLQEWANQLEPTTGLPGLYAELFGSPWTRAQMVEPLYPPDLAQPNLILPFWQSQVWVFSGGPHGAWEHDGAWAALDFAPASAAPGCTDSYSWVTASAPGLVVRSERGVVVIDMDGDGYEQTGWALFYLHVADQGRIAAGTLVEQGDKLGFPSCEGGIATGTHVHIARKYNGEWIPADGPLPFVLSGWRAHAASEPYKGTLTRDDQVINASVLGISAAVITRTSQDP